MPKLGAIAKRSNSSDQIVNLLYNTGYRLTGSHRITQKLLEDVCNALNVESRINFNISLQSLCLIYLNNPTAGLSKNLPKDKSSPPVKGNNSGKIQAALLTLPPTERLVLVLRDMLGLNYTEIAKLIGIEKTAVTRLLNTGRWALRKQLVTPPEKSRQTEKYFVAK